MGSWQDAPLFNPFTEVIENPIGPGFSITAVRGGGPSKGYRVFNNHGKRGFPPANPGYCRSLYGHIYFHEMINVMKYEMLNVECHEMLMLMLDICKP